MSSSAITGPIFTDVRRSPSGSAAAPSWSFNDSQGTGFYLVSADVLGLSTAGVQRVVVDASGNVGIGTASPTAKLDVNGAAIIGPTTGSVTHVFRSAATTLPSGLVNTTCHFTNRNAGAAVTASGWVAASFGARDNAASTIIIGSAGGNTYIAGHSADLNAWAPVKTRGSSAIEYYRTDSETVGWRAGLEVGGADSSFIVYNRNGTGVFLSFNGTSWSANSDERMKKNIKPLELGLEQIKALKPARFDYNQDESESSARIGFIAQEVLPVLPHAVSVPEDSEQMLGVSATEMIPVLVKAIQELEARLAALEAK